LKYQYVELLEKLPIAQTIKRMLNQPPRRISHFLNYLKFLEAAIGKLLMIFAINQVMMP